MMNEEQNQFTTKADYPMSKHALPRIFL